VRDQAEQKALGKMGTMMHKGRDRKHVVYGFMGCMAQSRGEELFKAVPSLDVVVGTQKYHKVFEYVDGILQRRLEARMDDPAIRCAAADVLRRGRGGGLAKHHPRPRHKARGQRLCLHHAGLQHALLVLHRAGHPRQGARPADPDIVGEVRHLAAHGVKEVTLLGQIVNLVRPHRVSAGDGKSPFVQLLEAVHEVDGIERIRFTSPHPIGYRDDLVAAFTYLPKLCSHIHFPMQSGSDRILREMRRPYKNEKFIEICEKMKAARPGLAITTDIIVGFPGESPRRWCG
jgi:tRNA-2-methylthio-N6-dimethylallyladenosine synthase